MPRGRSVLFVLLAGSTLTVMAGTVLSPVLPLIRRELQLGGTAAGLLLTAHGLALAVASPLAGWLLDRYGIRRPLVAGLLLYGVAGGSGLFIDSYGVLFAARLAFGVGAAAVFSGTTLALLTLYQGPERDRAMGRRSTAISLGGILWPLLGGALGTISWHGPFAVHLIGLPLALGVLLLLPADTGTRTAGGGTAFTLLRLRPRLLGLYAISFTSSLLLYVLSVFLPQRLAQAGIDEPALIAPYTAASSLAASAAGLAYAKARAYLGYAAFLRVAGACWTLGLLVAGTATRPAALLAAPALFGLGMGMSVPAMTVLINRTAPPHLKGQATALSGTAAFSGQFLSPVFFGPLVAATSLAHGLLAAAGLAAVVLLAVLVLPLPLPDAGEAIPSSAAGAHRPSRTDPAGTRHP
ncbi:MFS transporter [Streptomyces cyaneochromogenes]|uniref:MFS transporter n=1 Tax=Streptomyces cyaneochromogenes TaxID=2496836 RepID=A0A3S9MFT0_9ACTN|nr:MFS transporter [Streptomyces cyaneochromogenes]AZQ37978.1 MFS transporter [Streptomyces cyaneochromogenes]